MDIKALTQLIQLSMLKTISSDGSSDTSSSEDLSGDNFTTLLQSLIEQTATSSSNSGNTAEWIQNKGLDTPESSTNIPTNNNTSSELNSTEYDNEQINNAISAAAKKYGVDESFIRAVVKQESGFNQNAVSKAGAEGLMQLMPKTAESLGVDNPLDALQNIDGGTKYIKNLIDAFKGSKELALSAYNGGISRMNKRGVDSVDEITKMPGETQNYVAKVMKAYDSYKKLD